MLENKIIDGIISEPLGGAHTDIPAAAKEVKKVILRQIKALSKLEPRDRIEKRMDKFFKMGVVVE